MIFKFSPTPHSFIPPKLYFSVDNTPPVPSCPVDTLVEAGLSETSRQVFFTEPTATDNSGVAPRVVSQTYSPGFNFTLGTTQVTYTFADDSDNRVSCSFNVIVIQGQYY